jgi:hypothetical protein
MKLSGNEIHDLSAIVSIKTSFGLSSPTPVAPERALQGEFAGFLIFHKQLTYNCVYLYEVRLSALYEIRFGYFLFNSLWFT